jgi:two-component system chemotaxis response regulator CheB
MSMIDARPRGASSIPPIIAVGGSAGSMGALQSLLAALPPWLSATVVVVQHMAPSTEYVSMLPELLRAHCRLPVQWAEDGAVVMRSRVYVAPQDHHTQVTLDGSFHVTRTQARPRPSIDGLFDSVAQACRERCIGIVLSGRLQDGAQGARSVAASGGTVIVQDPELALHRDMPLAVLGLGVGALVLPPARMADAIASHLLMVGGRAWFRVSADSAYMGTVTPPASS